jgi:outer membrane protein assembly factor BamB
MCKTYRVLVLALAFCLHQPAYPQTPAGDWTIAPWVQNMLALESARLQILDSEWRELAGASWSVNDQTLASISVDERNKNVAVLQALAPGKVIVTANLNGVKHSITINIWSEHYPPDHRGRWNSIAFGRRINEVKARRTSDDQPSSYMAAQAGRVAVVHAVDDDGLQLWRWMVPESDGNAAELLCGDNDGGVLVRLQRAHDYVIYHLSAKGELQWTYFGRDKLQSHAFGGDNTLYLSEASPDRLQVRLVGVEGIQGKEKFNHPVPQSLVTLTSISFQRLSFFCNPGLRMQSPAASTFSGLIINTDGHAYLAFTVSRGELEALNCSPETMSQTAQVRRRYDHSLFLWQVSPLGAVTTTLVQRDQGEIVLSNDWPPSLQPTGDLIPDGNGGVLLAVRQFVRTPFNSPPHGYDYIYRITNEGKLAYKLALPGAIRKEDGMALNDQNHAFITVENLVICFNSLSGAEVWRYDAQTQNVNIVFAAEDGSVVVQDSNHHVIALNQDGKKTAEEYLDPAHQSKPILPH